MGGGAPALVPTLPGWGSRTGGVAAATRPFPTMCSPTKSCGAAPGLRITNAFAMFQRTRLSLYSDLGTAWFPAHPSRSDLLCRRKVVQLLDLLAPYIAIKAVRDSCPAKIVAGQANSAAFLSRNAEKN